MEIESFKNPIYKCNRCGFCFDLSGLGQYKMCPVNEVKGFQSYSAKGKLILATLILEGKIQLNEEALKHVFTCCDCGACEQNCFLSLELGSIFDALKRDLVAKRLVLKEHASMLDNAQRFGNIFGTSEKKRHTDFSPKAETLYFMGCTTSLVRKRIARATCEALKQCGLDFTVLRNEKCCGFPLLSVGQTGPARELAQNAVKQIEETGAKRVVFSCPGCYRMYKKEYPKLVKQLPFETIHTTELFQELVDEEKLRFKRKLPFRITYHDPCHLGRHMGVYEPPRRTLAQIPSLTVLEMTRNKQYAYCCGAGGGNLPQAFPEISACIAINRMKEAEETGARMLVSSCPACSSNLMLAKSRSKSNLEIKDIAEVIVEALK